MDMEYALRIGSCPDWNSSAHHLLLRAHLVLFPSYHIHCNSCRHGHSLPLLHADVAESLPASVADSRSRLLADKLDCQGIGIHHSFANTAFHLISLAPGASIDGIHLPLPALFCIYAVIGLVYAGWVRIKG